MSELLNRVTQGDCLEVMKQIPDNSVDMILCDLPYGTTACKWDTIIPFEPLWAEYERIIKDNGAIVLTAVQPFTTTLISSKINLFRYTWVWEKTIAANFPHAKNMPLKTHEDICVFSKGIVAHKLQSSRRMAYNPQGIEKTDTVWKRPKKYDSEHNFKRPSHELERTIEYTGYPKSVLRFSNGNNKSVHPTQKPVDLFEYLIKTYTNEGETVLDNCLGSGTTAIAAINTNRNFIGIEREPEYVEIAQKRIDEALANK